MRSTVDTHSSQQSIMRQDFASHANVEHRARNHRDTCNVVKQVTDQRRRRRRLQNEMTMTWKLLLYPFLPSELLELSPNGDCPPARLARRSRLTRCGKNQLTRCNKDLPTSAVMDPRIHTERRIAKAHQLVQMGEISFAKQVLERAALVPGTRANFDILRDPSRSPNLPREPVPDIPANASSPATFGQLEDRQGVLLTLISSTGLESCRQKKGASIMVAAGLCTGLHSVGHVSPPHSIPPETKINAAHHQDMLSSCYDPWAKTFCGADAVFQQEDPPSHTAPTTRALLGVMFRETLAWPALSPDVSPNEYAWWRFMGISRRPREPNGHHDATRSHHQDPREDHG